jgi:hypothetical protein
MRIFAGKHVPRCGNAATAGWFVYRGEFSPLLSTSRWTELFSTKGFGHAVRKNDCELGGDRLFNICI